MKMLVFLLVSAFSLAHAGPRVGNGGGAWACQATTGEYRWLRLVDLFEAENEFALKLVPAPAQKPWQILEERFQYVTQQLPQLAQVLVLTPQQLQAITKMVPQYTELTRIEDDQIRVRPAPGLCEKGVLFYGQFADFTFDGRLLIAGDLWNAPVMTNLDRAALLMHEIIYKSLRDKYGDTNSSRARALVGLLFSDLNAEKMNAEVSKVLNQQGSVGHESPLSYGKYKLICFAHIESEIDATVPGKIVYLNDGASSDQKSVILQGFNFTVRTDAKNSDFPVQLSITELSTGVRTSSDEQSTTTSFRRDGRTALSLELTNTNQIVFLECRAQAKPGTM